MGKLEKEKKMKQKKKTKKASKKANEKKKETKKTSRRKKPAKKVVQKKTSTLGSMWKELTVEIKNKCEENAEWKQFDDVQKAMEHLKQIGKSPSLSGIYNVYRSITKSHQDHVWKWGRKASRKSNQKRNSTVKRPQTRSMAKAKPKV